MPYIYICESTFNRLLKYRRRGDTYSDTLDVLMDGAERDYS